jgi:malonyl CoA-acyl carrier protein transacylase
LLGGADAPQSGLEIGPGSVLAGLMKRIARDFPMASTSDADALQNALSAIAERRDPE